MIDYELRRYPGEQIIAVAPDEAVLDVQFDNGYGCVEGPSFTVWTEHRVIFPVCYDGSEWVVSVPRNPNDEATDHVGGC